MDPHLLRTFVAVVRRGSFSAAAGELGYTQSAVSQHVAALEDQLKVALLHRRPVTPTEAGQRLLEHARPILLRLEVARAELARLAGAPPARLVVGASPLATALLVGRFDELLRSMPRLDLTMRVVARARITEQVATGEIDLGVVDGVGAPGDPLRVTAGSPLSAVGIAEDELVTALPAGHPLAARNRLRLDGLVDARWIDAPDIVPSPAELRGMTRSAGFRASLRYDGTDVRSLLELVADEHGLALLPRSAVRTAARVVAVAVGSPRLVHRTELVRGRVAGSPAETLAQLLAGKGAGAEAAVGASG